MPAVNLSPLFNAITNQDSGGNLLSLGQIYTYQAGSTTPYATYSDSMGNIANTNPIILGTDAKVNGLLWLEQNIAYKFVVQNQVGTQVATYDNISGVVTAVPSVQLFPPGIIVIWSGSIGSVPDGWALCDGTNGRPDLRDKFVIGAGNLYPVAIQGGSKDSIVVQHAHTANSAVVDPGHNHTYTRYGGFLPQSGSSTQCWFSTASDTTSTATTGISVNTMIFNSGSSGTNANLPPYYSLAYIIRTQ